MRAYHFLLSQQARKLVEYDARSETRLSIETSPVARTERGASRLKKSKFALMMLTAKRSSLPPRSLSLPLPLRYSGARRKDNRNVLASIFHQKIH